MLMKLTVADVLVVADPQLRREDSILRRNLFRRRHVLNSRTRWRCAQNDLRQAEVIEYNSTGKIGRFNNLKISAKFLKTT